MRFASAPETLPPPASGADEIRKGADEILSRPEFQEPPRSLYQRAMDEVVERLGDVVELLVRGGRGAVLAWIVLALVAAGAAFLAVRGLRSGGGRKTRAAGGAPHVDARRPPPDWAEDAARLEAEGAWREALRCRYRWLIATLAGAGVVDEIPGATAGEYRALVAAARPASAAPLAGATELFERSWYGHEQTGPDEAAEFGDLAHRVVEAATAR